MRKLYVTLSAVVVAMALGAGPVAAAIHLD